MRKPSVINASPLFVEIVDKLEVKGKSITQMCMDLQIPYHQVAKFKKGSKDLELIQKINEYLK